MINLKTKFEGSLNRPCAKHNEVQRYHEEFVSDRASCLQANSHARKLVSMTLKKNVNLQHYKKWGTMYIIE